MMRRLGSSSYVHMNIVIQAEQTNNDNVTLRIICRPVKYWSCLMAYFARVVLVCSGPAGVHVVFLFVWSSTPALMPPNHCFPEPGWQDTTQGAVELFLGTVSAFKFKMQSTRI
jgi:hypothetical protein